MKNISDEICRENENNISSSSNFFSKNPAVCQTMWKNNVELVVLVMAIWRMRIAC